jgi:hypothetical protein
MFLPHDFVGKCFLHHDSLHFVSIYVCLFESYSFYDQGCSFILLYLHIRGMYQSTRYRVLEDDFLCLQVGTTVTSLNKS